MKYTDTEYSILFIKREIQYKGMIFIISVKSDGDFYRWKVNVYQYIDKYETTPRELIIPEGNVFKYRNDALQIGTDLVKNYIKKNLKQKKGDGK